MILQLSLTVPFSISFSVQDVLLTAADLLKLEKLEIGGVRGRALSQQVQLLHQEFADTYKLFTEKPYDCLDLNNTVRSIRIRVHDAFVHLLALGKIVCNFVEQLLTVSSFSQRCHETRDAGYKLSTSQYMLFFLSGWQTPPQPGHSCVCGANCVPVPNEIKFFSVPSSCLSKMFLGYSNEKQFTLLVRPSQCSPAGWL